MLILILVNSWTSFVTNPTRCFFFPCYLCCVLGAHGNWGIIYCCAHVTAKILSTSVFAFMMDSFLCQQYNSVSEALMYCNNGFNSAVCVKICLYKNVKLT